VATAPGAHEVPAMQSASVAQGKAHLPTATLQRCVPHAASLVHARAAGPGAASAEGEGTGGAGNEPEGGTDTEGVCATGAGAPALHAASATTTGAQRKAAALIALGAS